MAEEEPAKKQKKEGVTREQLEKMIEEDVDKVRFFHFTRLSSGAKDPAIFDNLMTAVRGVRDERHISCVSGVLFAEDLDQHGRCGRPGCTTDHGADSLLPEDERREIFRGILSA